MGGSKQPHNKFNINLLPKSKNEFIKTKRWFGLRKPIISTDLDAVVHNKAIQLITKNPEHSHLYVQVKDALSLGKGLAQMTDFEKFKLGFKKQPDGSFVHLIESEPTYSNPIFMQSFINRKKLISANPLPEEPQHNLYSYQSY